MKKLIDVRNNSNVALNDMLLQFQEAVLEGYRLSEEGEWATCLGNHAFMTFNIPVVKNETVKEQGTSVKLQAEIIETPLEGSEKESTQEVNSGEVKTTGTKRGRKSKKAQ